MTHDPLCPMDEDTFCECALIARVRADQVRACFGKVSDAFGVIVARQVLGNNPEPATLGFRSEVPTAKGEK